MKNIKKFEISPTLITSLLKYIMLYSVAFLCIISISNSNGQFIGANPLHNSVFGYSNTPSLGFPGFSGYSGNPFLLYSPPRGIQSRSFQQDCSYTSEGRICRPDFSRGFYPQSSIPVSGYYGSIAEAFVRNQVIPDVIDEAPTAVAEVQYINKFVRLGNILTPTDVNQPPTVIDWPAYPDKYYTIIMTDPDAPSRYEATAREWHHWLIVNIPGNNVSAGKVLSEYIGSGPPLGTGLHRYIFLIYEQPGKLEFNENYLSDQTDVGRAGFNTRKFVKKYGLLGPVAGNFYQAQWDQSVPNLPFNRNKNIVN